MTLTVLLLPAAQLKAPIPILPNVYLSKCELEHLVVSGVVTKEHLTGHRILSAVHSACAASLTARRLLYRHCNAVTPNVVRGVRSSTSSFCAVLAQSLMNCVLISYSIFMPLAAFFSLTSC